MSACAHHFPIWIFVILTNLSRNCTHVYHFIKGPTMSASSAGYLQKHGINILTPDSPQALALEQKQFSPTIHGDKVWSSTYVVMDRSEENTSELQSSGQ